MKSNKNIFIGSLIVIAITAVATFANYRNLPQQTASQETIRIGLDYALSGAASIWAENGRKAAQMAADEINAAGGVNGHKLELVIEDSKTDPKSGIAAFDKLTSIDSIHIVLGDSWSFITNPLIPLADKTKTILISPTVMDASVEGSSPYFFTLGHTVDSQENAVRKFFSSNPEIKTVYNVCWNDAWGTNHTALLHKIASELGIRIAGETCTGDFGSNYRTEAAKVKASHANAVFLTSTHEDDAVRALVDLHVPVKILTTTGMVEAVHARNFPLSYTKNLWFMDWVPNEGFMKKFHDKYGTYPIMEPQNHYEAVYAVAKAIEKNPNDVLAGLKQVKYSGADGDIDFTGNPIRINKAEAKLYTFGANRELIEAK
ncbi:MAG: branched chain amino acid transporter substrate-binding protein [Candidatus Taylorbacteria bacterium]|nr:branched chain amino acid transporter substrate-binding protein [Candidatus Taylorbacteria bacterium]